MIVTYARIYHHIRKRALSEVMNRCSDIRPDSFSSSEPQPLRYALATQQVSKPKKERKSKKKKIDLQSPSMDEPAGVTRDGLSNNQCEADACDGFGVAVPPSDARWRCNMCGATRGKSEEWTTYPLAQIDETKVSI